MKDQIIEYIKNPALLNCDTLQPLRDLVIRYPYYQTARLLYLQNLFLLHDAAFGEELRKAALFVPDRCVLFRMVEGKNYEIIISQSDKKSQNKENVDRTVSLIDRFLTTLPEENKTNKKLTITDAMTDYASYLMQLDDMEGVQSEIPLKGQNLIDDFIERSPERIVLQENPKFLPEVPVATDDEDSDIEEDFFTETLAKIYIKQGRYEKAIEIIHKLSTNYPKKNSYFADQIRFLGKLVINNKNKKKH